MTAHDWEDGEDPEKQAADWLNRRANFPHF
jgi:hypothetical protein